MVETQKTKSGRHLILRAPRREDDEQMNLLVNLPGVRAGTFRLPFTTIESTRRWLEHHAANGFDVVAEVEGVVVGLAGMHRFESRRSHAGGFYMLVHDEYWGDGIGSALLSAVIDAAENWHAVARIELMVFVDNIAAIKLYEKFGFEHEGRGRSFAFRNGEYVDSYFMARLRR